MAQKHVLGNHPPTPFNANKDMALIDFDDMDSLDSYAEEKNVTSDVQMETH